MKNKKQIQEIKKIIKKYNTSLSPKKTMALFSATTLSAGGLILAADILLTGGMTGLITMSGCLFGIATYSGIDFIKSTDKIRTNHALQSIQSNERIASTLDNMEYKLQIVFNEASHPLATRTTKNKFLELSEEIKTDLKTISPAFKIIDGGAAGFSEDEYVFTVAERFTRPGEKKLITLQTAIEEINGTSKPSTFKTHAKKERPKGSFGL